MSYKLLKSNFILILRNEKLQVTVTFINLHTNDGSTKDASETHVHSWALASQYYNNQHLVLANSAMGWHFMRIRFKLNDVGSSKGRSTWCLKRFSPA